MDGVIEPVQVHFEDLDAMGVVHNGRYVLLLERALAAYWTRVGYAFDPAASSFKDVFFVVREFTITYHAPLDATALPPDADRRARPEILMALARERIAAALPA